MAVGPRTLIPTMYDVGTGIGTRRNHYQKIPLMACLGLNQQLEPEGTSTLQVAASRLHQSRDSNLAAGKPAGYIKVARCEVGHSTIHGLAGDGPMNM